MDKDKEMRMKIKIFAAIMAASDTVGDVIGASYKTNRVFEILQEGNND